MAERKANWAAWLGLFLMVVLTVLIVVPSTHTARVGFALIGNRGTSAETVRNAPFETS